MEAKLLQSIRVLHAQLKKKRLIFVSLLKLSPFVGSKLARCASDREKREKKKTRFICIRQFFVRKLKDETKVTRMVWRSISSLSSAVEVVRAENGRTKCAGALKIFRCSGFEWKKEKKAAQEHRGCAGASTFFFSFTMS